MESNGRFGGGMGIQSFDDMEKGLVFTERQHLLQYAEAKVGLQLEEFLGSTVGRYVIGRAQQEIADFIDWALSDSAKATEFEQRRAKALAARTLVQWFSTQVAAGQDAEKLLRESEQG